MRKPVALLMSVCGCLAQAAWAQQPAAAPKPQPAVVDPIARDLLATNPKTPIDIVRALDLLIDLRQAKVGESLLKKLADLQLDDQQLADLDRQLGSGVFLKLALAPELQPLGKQLADRVLEAANKQARDPAHLAALVEELKSPNASARAQAIAELNRGGDAAVSALMKALAEAMDPASRAAASEGLLALGELSAGALASTLAGDRNELATEAARLLGRIESEQPAQNPALRWWLLAPALGAHAAAEVREAARQALAVAAGLPQPVEAAAELYRAALKFDQQPPALPSGAGGLATLWTWDAKAHLPVPERLPQRIVTRELASRLAAAGREILPGEPALVTLQNTLLLEAAIERAGGLARIDRGPAGAWARVADEELPAIEQLLDFAASHQHPGPAAVAAEILGARGGADLLAGTGGQATPLVRAAAHPDRRLRFAAVGAIVAIDPQDPYPGSSLVADAMKFFMGSHGARVAVVGDVRPAAAQQFVSLLAPLGYEVRTATSNRELVRQAISTPDLELVLVDMLLADELAGKVVQDLRHDCRTAYVPVGLLAASWEINRAGVLSRRLPRTAAMLRPLDPAAAQAAVAQVSQFADHSVPAAERLSQSQQAFAWLASRSQATRGELYPLVHFEPELLSALALPSLVAAAVPLVGELGTPACQQALVELASSQSSPVATRQAAAAAFGKNVARHGILLTHGQILRQYDRYNASESADHQTQTVLASILDSMEQHRARQAARAPVR